MRSSTLSSGKRRSSRHSGRRWRRTKNFVQWTKVVSAGRFLSALPLVLVLLVTCLDFITFEYAVDDPTGLFSLRSVGSFQTDAARLRADALQKNVQAVAYVLAILFMIPHLGSLFRFFWRERAFSLILLVILLTSLVSDNATKVYTNTIHIGFGLITAFLYIYPLRHRHDLIKQVLWVIFVASGMVLLGSFLFWLANMADNLEAYDKGFRYGGFVGNPNNMGWVCMIACWSALGLATNREIRRVVRFFTLSLVFLAVSSAILADSVTTYVVLALIASFALWDYFIKSFSARTQKMLKTIFIIALVVVMPLFVLYLVGTGSLIATASESLTGDSTLTGRSDIWEVGQAAIFERPLLGWSFDAHLTVSESSYSIPYTQYHNGYIDTLVSGGITLFIALMVQVGMTTWRTLRIAGQGIMVFPVVSFLAVVFVANISEYAILRIDNPIWQTYVVCAVAIAAIQLSTNHADVSSSKATRASNRSSGRSSSKSRDKKRYRF